ncbi:MAG TPA: hypothetical protein VGQ28_14985, partial [Thermoanaerobaculia bacterium]|nr:hypothetical protein [Thermoanaerobaculia bacterium]
MTALRRGAAALAPVLLGTAWLASLFAPVLPPSRALANRDVALFHLPLRTAFRDLAAYGLPAWNPWLHGGQPILSNPSYGAFYPPSWLVLLVPPYYALTLMAVLHAALAFAGAWRLARRLGGGRGAAALAGVGFAGCGVYLSLLSAFNLYWGISWLPWVLAWGDEALRAGPEEPWRRPALLAGGALGLALLNGEPSTAMMSGLALLALAASAGFRRPAAAVRVLLPFLMALALAAVQLVPTLGRLADSPRRGLPAGYATVWSLPPPRLAEVVLPRFFGDPARTSEGLFFGWGIDDLDYPYLESLYPGLLLAVLGAAALLRGRIPRRAAWAAAVAGGVLLALGRHNPMYEALRRTVPLLGLLRFPERFALLAVLALLLAGALSWQRLLDDRQAGRPEAADFPLAVSLVVLGTALTLALLLRYEPRMAAGFVAAHGAPDLDAAHRLAAAAYLRAEGWAAVATAAAVAALLALCRWPRPSRRLLSLLAVALLAGDLWHYGHGLLRTVPAAVYRVPPPLAASLLPARDRVWLEPAPAGERLPLWDARTAFTRVYLSRLEPYSGLLWQIPYAFHKDYDLMLTGWARKAAGILDEERAQPQAAYRYLGVWNVGTLLLRRTAADQPPAASGPGAAVLRKVANSYVLPRFRFVPRVTFHATHPEALAAARAGGWNVARNEQCVGPPRTAAYPQRAVLLEIEDQGGRLLLHYRAARGAFLVAATTFDPGWRARLDGLPVAVSPTAACQLGVELPPGEHRLDLRYRDPWLPAGAALSLAALAVGTAALLRRTKRR